MTPTEQKSLLSIAMLAAFADQSKNDRERDEVRQVAESLGGDLNVAADADARATAPLASGAAPAVTVTGTAPAIWAPGQVAKRYYAGGRVMSTAMLRQAFAGLTDQGRSLQQQYLPRIREQAQTLDVGRIMSMVSGTPDRSLPGP